ncbi:MAG TPA: N-formylglutamate amidohydrolase, partial [Myxococcota bacterium]
MNDAPATFELIADTSGPPTSPLVVSVPHAGTRVPDGDRPLLALEGPALLRDADLFVDRLYAQVPGRGIATLRALVSRYVLDVNRAPDDVDREVCPGIESNRAARTSARGLVWRVTTDGAPVLSRPLTKAELDSRIARIHTPYHDALARLLEERRAHFGYA